MSLHRHLYLAAYDIRCDRRRTAALKRVRGHATGGQKSVHEVWLTSGEKVSLLTDMPSYLAESDRFCLLRLEVGWSFMPIALSRTFAASSRASAMWP